MTLSTPIPNCVFHFFLGLSPIFLFMPGTWPPAVLESHPKELSPWWEVVWRAYAWPRLGGLYSPCYRGGVGAVVNRSSRTPGDGSNDSQEKDWSCDKNKSWSQGQQKSITPTGSAVTLIPLGQMSKGAPALHNITPNVHYSRSLKLLSP